MALVKTFNPREVKETVSGFLGTRFIEPTRAIPVHRDLSYAAAGFGIKTPSIGTPFISKVIEPVPRPPFILPPPKKMWSVGEIVKPVPRLPDIPLPPPKTPWGMPIARKVIKPVPIPEPKIPIKGIEIDKPYVYPGGFTGETPKPSLKEGVDPTVSFPIPIPTISGGEVIASEKRTPSEPEKITPITEKIGISKSFIESALPLIIGAIVIFNFLKK